MTNKIEKFTIYSRVASLLQTAKQRTVSAINSTMVYTYYQIGRIIVEEEQQGESRAEYGKALLKKLSERLTHEFGRGFSSTNLEQILQNIFPYLQDSSDSV